MTTQSESTARSEYNYKQHTPICTNAPLAPILVYVLAPCHPHRRLRAPLTRTWSSQPFHALPDPLHLPLPPTPRRPPIIALLLRRMEALLLARPRLILLVHQHMLVPPRLRAHLSLALGLRVGPAPGLRAALGEALGGDDRVDRRAPPALGVPVLAQAVTEVVFLARLVVGQPLELERFVRGRALVGVGPDEGGDEVLRFLRDFAPVLLVAGERR